MDVFYKAKQFVYRNARPLDLQRWKFHFEGGSREAVLEALAYFQNEDGGFGHALEADLWNVNSSPLATSTAIGLLKELDFFEPEHRIIKGILRYLEQTPAQEARGWYLKVPTNNEYPHSIWWEYDEKTDCGFDGEWQYNPTAILVGFILKTADKSSELYQHALEIAVCAIEKIARDKSIEMHEAGCFCMLLEFLKSLDEIPEQIDVEILEKYLRIAVHEAIEHDVSKWSGYCARPSQYFLSKDSIFYQDNKATADYECEYIRTTQLEDGSYPVPWQWWTEYKEFEVAANWWRSHIIIENMGYLRGME